MLPRTPLENVAAHRRRDTILGGKCFARLSPDVTAPHLADIIHSLSQNPHIVTYSFLRFAGQHNAALLGLFPRFS